MYNRGYECGPWNHRGREVQQSPVNITDAGDAYVINMYAPLLNKEQFSITTQNDILTVKYNEDNKTDDNKYTRREYRPAEIDRSFDLKGKVDTEAIKASYTDGVLSIRLPKTEAARKLAQQVEVK